jgi:hypothetical protein
MNVGNFHLLFSAKENGGSCGKFREVPVAF